MEEAEDEEQVKQSTSDNIIAETPRPVYLLEKLSSNILENSVSPKVELTKNESSLENSQDLQPAGSPVPILPADGA